MTPFVLYERPPSEKRVVVTPNPHDDGIADPLEVCRNLAAVASVNNVEVKTGTISASGAVRLLGEAA